MKAEFQKVSTVLTQKSAKELCKKEYVVIVSITSEGVEVRDMRKLVDRLENPIKGRGVVRYFGDTHFIITPKYAEKIGAKA